MKYPARTSYGRRRLPAVLAVFMLVAASASVARSPLSGVEPTGREGAETKKSKKDKARKVKYPLERSVPMACEPPTFELMPPSEVLQRHGGMSMAVVAAAAYDCYQDIEVRVSSVRPTFKQRLAAAVMAEEGEPPMRYVEQVTTPVLRVSPERLRFQISLSNSMSRVFRGEGLVVQCVIAGQLDGVEPERYRELARSVVPPGTQHQVELEGPPVDSIPDGSTVGLLLFDVATGIDRAGQVTDRHNFEWLFKLTRQPRIENGIERVERGWVRP